MLTKASFRAMTASYFLAKEGALLPLRPGCSHTGDRSTRRRHKALAGVPRTSGQCSEGRRAPRAPHGSTSSTSSNRSCILSGPSKHESNYLRQKDGSTPLIGGVGFDPCKNLAYLT